MKIFTMDQPKSTPLPSNSNCFRAILSANLLTSFLACASFLFFLFFLFVPLGNVFKQAFLTKQGFTLAYIKFLFCDQGFFYALYNSFKIAICTTVTTLLLSLPLALLNIRFRYKGKELFSTLLLLSTVIPPFVGPIGMQYLFSQYGTLNQLLFASGWISKPLPFFNGQAIWPIVFLQVLQLFPVMYANLLGTLLNINPSLEEAGVTLGISTFRRYKDITLPLARPGLLAGIILVFVRSLTDLGTPLITSFRSVLPVAIYEELREISDNPYGYVLLFAMTLITLALTLTVRWLLKVDKRYNAEDKGYVKRRMLRPTLKQKIALYALFSLLLPLAFMPHLFVLLLSIKSKWFASPLPEAYSLEAYRYLLKGSLLHSLQNSLLYACCATLLIGVLGTFLSYVIAKRKTRFYAIVDGVAMLPFLLPGVVLGFSYFVTYTDSWLDPTQTPGLLLVMGYSMHYLPYMIRTAVAGFEQLSPSLEEAAVVLGLSQLRILYTISLPILLPSLLSISLLIFSKAMFEVSCSLMLAARETDYPVAKVMYMLCNTQGDGDSKAAVLAIATLAAIAVIMFVAGRIQPKKREQLFRFSE